MNPGTSGSSAPTLLSVSTKNHHMIIRLDAVAIGPREATIMATEVTRALEHAVKGKSLVIDLSRTVSLSSMGLGLCVDIRNRAVDSGMRPILTGMNVQLADLFGMMRVDRLFTIASSAAELERYLL